MLHFKCLDDLNQLHRSDPAYPHVQRLIQTCLLHDGYDPEAEGWIVVCEQSDIGQPLIDLGWTDQLIDLPFEANRHLDGFYECVLICNNEFGIVFLIPDAEWLPAALRDHIERYLDYGSEAIL